MYLHFIHSKDPSKLRIQSEPQMPLLIVLKSIERFPQNYITCKKTKYADISIKSREERELWRSLLSRVTSVNLFLK